MGGPLTSGPHSTLPRPRAPHGALSDPEGPSRPPRPQGPGAPLGPRPVLWAALPALQESGATGPRSPWWPWSSEAPVRRGDCPPARLTVASELPSEDAKEEGPGPGGGSGGGSGGGLGPGGGAGWSADWLSPQVGILLHYATLSTMLWIGVTARSIYKQVTKKAPLCPGADQPPEPKQPLLRY